MLDLSELHPMAAGLPEAKPDSWLAARVWTLLVDYVTGSVVGELNDRQIDSILLKGAAFARLLYDREDERPYTDTDLLIRDEDVAGAERCLQDLGFVRIDRDEDWMGPAPKYSHTFKRPADGAMVDLHWLLSGSLVSPAKLWSTLVDHTVELEVAGRTVVALDATASALLVALHNAHHGTGHPSALSDLDRAVERLDEDEWRAANGLADDVGAAKPFAAGLRLTAAGDALADRMGLDRPASVELWLKSNPSTYGAWVVDRFMQTKTLRGRLDIGLQVIVPPRVVMYRFFPLARRGRIGLGLAYLVRPLRLAMQAPPAIRDLTRARRAVRAQRS